MQDVQAKVFRIIADTAGVDAGRIAPTDTVQGLGIASLDAIDMIFRIEEQCGIELNDRDVDLKVATAAMLVTAVEKALAARARSAVASSAG